MATRDLALTLSCDGPDADGRVDGRLTVFNAGTEPVRFDRRLLFGDPRAYGARSSQPAM